MLNSKIKTVNGRPTLYIEDSPYTAMAYTTYFEERSRYEDFIKAGYRIFFVNVSFTTLPINTVTEFSPFRVGVFDDINKEDYSEFEDAVNKILTACPDAVIFPRINISMPKWWIDAHPDDVTKTAKGRYREALASEAFRNDACELLTRLIRHIKSKDYSSRIGGWQICGGMTQEWFHFDYCGGVCNDTARQYREFARQSFGDGNADPAYPDDYLYTGTAYNYNDNQRHYSLFANLSVAKTVERFASTVKRETSGEQIVGVFYGYSFECGGVVLFGSHALRALIDSESLDFFSSPNAYTKNRAFGIDWADMMPTDSLSLHGKLCFMECDIRTYLTRAIQDVRPGKYPDDIYKTKDGDSVWVGPPTLELSREALRKCFAHQICKGSAVWWFDMWGGWYQDPELMGELTRMRSIYEKDLTSRGSSPTAEVVLFADERAYSNLFSASPQLAGINDTRTAMGNTGVPYDTYMAEDASAVLEKYKAAVFIMPIPSEAGEHAIDLCKRLGIPYISASPEHYELTVEELQSFYKKNEIHSYTDATDVVYVGNGYIGLHTATAGKKLLKLPRPLAVTPIFGANTEYESTETISFEMQENTTALFKTQEVKACKKCEKAKDGGNDE